MIEEDFFAAKNAFQNFLSQNDLSTDLVWLFCEDVIWQQNQILVNSNSTLENQKLTEKFYKIGQKRNFGIQFFAFCEFNGKIGCAILLPEDALDAEYMMMSGKSLKFSFSKKIHQAKTVENKWIWKIYKNFVSKNNYFSKKVLLSKKLHIQIE